MAELRKKATDYGTPSQAFSALYGLKRVGDFRKILTMDAPNAEPNCNPVEAKLYLDRWLLPYIEQGYHFLLVPDQKAYDILKPRGLHTYKTVASIGNRLAIRQVANFEIAWSFEQPIISAFNESVQALEESAHAIRREEIDLCCKLIDETPESGAVDRHPSWSETAVQNRWRDAFKRTLKSSDVAFLKD
jgi:hypothetical protein